MVKKYFFRHWEKEGPKHAAHRDTSKKPRLLWGTTPLLNNAYWSKALKDAGYTSVSLMLQFYPTINRREDFDMYFEDVITQFYQRVPTIIKIYYKEYFVFDFILKNFDIVHTSCSGLTSIFSREAEVFFLKKFNIKTIVIPFGGDMFVYSKIINISRRHGMLVNYPWAAKKENEIERDVNCWVRNSDIFIPGSQVDGIGRWDILPCSILTIDSNKIPVKTNYTNFDGTNGTVKIIHAPNHRGPKGTDYIIHAVNELNAEGLQVELILLEKKQNDEVIRIMHEEADIAVDEIVGTFYALFSLEGMSSGIPVINNLSIEEYTRVFRRFSYLNEAPLVSATIENIKDVLRILVKNPSLRKELGIAGRQFVKKYHDTEMAKFIFEKLYEKIWYNKDIDLMNLFHPLKPESYNNQSPKIEHPLKENIIPAEYFKQEILKPQPTKNQ